MIGTAAQVGRHGAVGDEGQRGGRVVTR